MRKNKFLFSVLVILIFASLFPATTFAEEITSGDYNYTVNGDGTCTITKYTGADEDIAIPDSLDGYVVTSIGDAAFEATDWLINVTIPTNHFSRFAVGYNKVALPM